MLNIITLLGLLSCQGDSRSATQSPSENTKTTPSSLRPNILMVVLDTTRQDALGAYGNPLPTSPHFDALSKEGMLYTNAWSPAS